MMPARHLMGETLREQLDDLVMTSAHGRTSRPVHHVHIDPPPDCGDPNVVIETFIRNYEAEFGFENAQRAGVYHVKGGRKHAHVVWSLVNENGSVISLAHDHARREKVSRIVEFECGLELIKGKHNRSAAKALRAEGRADVADAMEAAGLLSGKRPVAHSTPRQRAQAERTATPLDEIRNQAYAAWKVSNDAKSFAVALHAFESLVATGDRGLVLVDRAGGTHSLNRVLAAAARADGKDRITAAMIRKRIGGIIFPPVKEAQNAQRYRRNSEHRDGDEKQHRESVAAPGPSERADGRDGEPDRRVEIIVDRDRGNSRTSHEGARAARKCLRDRAAIRQLKSVDLQGVIQAKGEIMREIRAKDYKAKIFAEIAPEGFNAFAFTDDLHMIQKPRPGRPSARIMTRDGGWIELDTRSGKTIRTWGNIGRASVIAQALANVLDVEVEHLAKTASVGADTEALRVAKISEDKIKSLAMWWSARGYVATAAADGCWVDAGHARIRDTGNRLEVHGGLTDTAVAAMILKAKEHWGGGMWLEGAWTQAEQDKLWIAAQRAGIDIGNCSPSKSIQAEWQREQGRSITQARTISAVRGEMVDAQDLIDAAKGDKNAVIRLPGTLQAFIAIHLDDEQRRHLAAQSVAGVLPELARFRQIGADELAEYERTGRKFIPPKPEQAGKPADENRYSPR
jgi:hypothetical protein